MRYIPFAILSLFLLDLISLIWVGHRFGVMTGLALMLIGIFVGFKLIKQSGAGFSELFRGQYFSGQTPQQRVIAKFLQAMAGVLFILPGFISDVMGFLLLLPITSQILARLIPSPVQFTVSPTSSYAQGPVIEGEIIQGGEDLFPNS